MSHNCIKISATKTELLMMQTKDDDCRHSGASGLLPVDVATINDHESLVASVGDT